jgi:hypothetical protein
MFLVPPFCQAPHPLCVLHVHSGVRVDEIIFVFHFEVLETGVVKVFGRISFPAVRVNDRALLNVIQDGGHERCCTSVRHFHDEAFLGLATRPTEDQLNRKHTISVVFTLREYTLIDFHNQFIAADLPAALAIKYRHASFAQVVVPVNDCVLVHLQLAFAPLD